MKLHTAYNVYLEMTGTDRKKRGFHAVRRAAFICAALKYYTNMELSRLTGLDHSCITYHDSIDHLRSDHKYNAGKSVTYIMNKRIADELLKNAIKNISHDNQEKDTRFQNQTIRGNMENQIQHSPEIICTDSRGHEGI